MHRVFVSSWRIERSFFYHEDAKTRRIAKLWLRLGCSVFIRWFIYKLCSVQAPFGSRARSRSLSPDEKRHEGKHPEHHVVHRSRHSVSCRKVLCDRQAANPEHEGEFRKQHKHERHATHTKAAP